MSESPTTQPDAMAPRLVRHENNPVSDHFLTHARLHNLAMADGTLLRTAYWSAADSCKPSRGTVLLLAGFSEFIEKYFETASDLHALGFAVLAFDWRGQGLSSRAQKDRRGWVQHYGLMMSDVLEVAAYSRDIEVPTPLLALGHSMGGNVCLRLLQNEPELFKAAAVTAPMLGIKGMPTWLLAGVTQTGSRVGLDERYTPGAKDNDPFGPHIPLCHDQQRIDIWRSYLRKEPLLITHGATWRWAREAATSMREANKPSNIARIKTPVLIANALQDSLVDPVPTQKFAALCRTAKLLELPTSQHEVMQETDTIRKRFFAAFDAFMCEHASVL